MKCHGLYLIADFENFSPDTLKMADICCYGIRYGKCELMRGKCAKETNFSSSYLNLIKQWVELLHS